jgi:Uncharacterized protein conserved in bacteria
MKYIILVLGVLIYLSSNEQDSKTPIEVTPQVEKQFKQKVEREVPAFKKQLELNKENEVQIEFSVDTFRIEHFIRLWEESVITDSDEAQASYAGAWLYDSLLNKYYKKLLLTLKPEDRQILQQAQRAWITFRDNESKLVDLISKDEYSGGGTKQRLTESYLYLLRVKNRTIEIFDHYVRATQSE